VKTSDLHPSSTAIRTLLAALLSLALPAAMSGQDLNGNVSCVDTSPATPLDGITVVASGLSVAGSYSTLTDSNGNYSFLINVSIPEIFRVTLTNLPPGLTYVNPGDGIRDVVVAPNAVATANFTMSGCDTPPNGEIGDRVWQDLNCDGIQDWDEPGMPGAPVELWDCSGGLLAETLTDSEGLYAFADLEPGDYSVRFFAPPGFVFSPENQGGNPNLDSDADPVTGFTVCFTLGAGQSDTSWDAGLCPLEAPGVRSQGYWKNHPDNWPVEQIEVGGVLYTKWEAITLMQLPTRGDKWPNMFEQVVAAKLNVMLGNESGCIATTLMDADVWLEIYPGPVPARSAAWRNSGRYLHADLDAYNNGFLCAPCAP